jgi:hypothetical protein
LIEKVKEGVSKVEAEADNEMKRKEENKDERLKITFE